MAVSVKTWRFTAYEYEQMGRAGILHEDDRVELVEGELIEMAPIGEEHANRVIDINHLFVNAFGDVARVSVQNPIRLNDNSEPQPDFALLRRPADGIRKGLPAPPDILLLVEVSDTTLSYDRDRKLPLYARSGIPEVWLLDLNGDAVIVFSDPSPDGYRASRTVRRGEWLAPLSFPGREIAVSDILG